MVLYGKSGGKLFVGKSNPDSIRGNATQYGSMQHILKCVWKNIFIYYHYVGIYIVTFLSSLGVC